ncbi:MAG: hypothetical protein AB1757_21770 [Acidobacteriota bacterium]
MRLKLVSLVITITFLFSLTFAQQNKSTPQAPQLSIDEIIQRFAASETENKIARNNYTFTQDYDLMTIGEAGSITGRYRRVSDIVFDNKSNRIEKITYFPQSTLTEINVTQADIQDIGGAQSFSLTTEDLPKYRITFIAKEKLDELNTYVFNVKPKEFRKGERYFDGKIWVDDIDLQIVKVAGQAVPEDENNQYPHFETYRENVDEKYWFPTYVYADDTLEFKRFSVHVRMVVKFTNYKKFSGTIRVLDDGGEIHNEEATDPAKDKKPETTSTTTKDEVKKVDEKKADEKKPDPKKPEATPKKP